MTEFLRQIFQQAYATGSRSTVMTPLLWLVAAVLAALAAAVQFAAPAWVLGCLIGLSFLVVVSALVAYLYFAIKDRDALRSEKFTLSKLAMERSERGDDRVGLTHEPMQQLVAPDTTTGAAP